MLKVGRIPDSQGRINTGCIYKKSCKKFYQRRKYIRRDALLCGYIDKTQKKILEEIAEEQGANFSQAFFQALVNYCALLITMDDSNIEITRK